MGSVVLSTTPTCGADNRHSQALHRSQADDAALWPPLQRVPVAKALEDVKRLKEEIMPNVEAM
jgi:hypothetical protein